MKKWDFVENFNGQEKFDSIWEDDSTSDSPRSYYLENGNLKITTRANSYDRVNVKTIENSFGAGVYHWKIYVPQFDLRDQCSIGAFLYHEQEGDVNYELDFEIGSGTSEHRAALEANSNEVLVHCTSHFLPFSTERFVIESERWYDFRIELKSVNRKYVANWYIDNRLVKSLTTEMNTDIKFAIHNSLENLKFMGDQQPVKENYTLMALTSYRK
ncbi:MAG: hypothetical protein ACJA01_001248 [Saprospiraceae bacterium]|jgi:hypothetical protein